MRRLTDEQAGEIRRRWARELERRYAAMPGDWYGGLTLATLAGEYSVSICAVSHAANGLTHTGRPHKSTSSRGQVGTFTAEKRALAREYYAKGLTLREIGAAMGYAHQTIATACADLTAARPKRWARGTAARAARGVGEAAG